MGNVVLHSGFGDRASAEHLHVPSVRPYLLRRVRSTTSLPHWQQEEVAALSAVAPLMREALASSRRAQLYLTERGIPPAIALSSGVGYLSRAAWEQAPVSREQQRLLKRWIGRIIFPLGSPDGQGFIGRTLLKWEPGMDENAHKALLDQPGAPRRWIKTNPAGWFGFDAPACLDEQVVLVEGGFDRLILLAAGFPANAVIALVGTAATACLAGAICTTGQTASCWPSMPTMAERWPWSDLPVSSGRLASSSRCVHHLTISGARIGANDGAGSAHRASGHSTKLCTQHSTSKNERNEL